MWTIQVTDYNPFTTKTIEPYDLAGADVNYNGVTFFRMSADATANVIATTGDSEAYIEYADWALTYAKAHDNQLPDWETTKAGLAAGEFSCLPTDAQCRGLHQNFKDTNTYLSSTDSVDEADGYNRPNYTTVQVSGYQEIDDPKTPEDEISPYNYEEVIDYDFLASVLMGTQDNPATTETLDDALSLQLEDFSIEFAVKDHKIIGYRIAFGEVSGFLQNLTYVETGSQTAMYGNEQGDPVARFSAIGKANPDVVCQNMTTADFCGEIAITSGLEDPALNQDVYIPAFALVAVNTAYYIAADTKNAWLSSIYQGLTNLTEEDCLGCGKSTASNMANKIDDLNKETGATFRWYDQTGAGVQVDTDNDPRTYEPYQPLDVDFKGANLHIKDIPLYFKE